MRLQLIISVCLLSVTSLFGISCATAGNTGNKNYDLRYIVKFQPAQKLAEVSIEVPDASLLEEIDFNLDAYHHSDVIANGKLTIEDGRAMWQPPKRNARLSLKAKIEHQRASGGYDALTTPDWTIFRGDDLVPPAKVVAKKGAESTATLEFKLPDGWTSVYTGWPQTGPTTFSVDNPERSFDRPVGWMIAGKLGGRRDTVGRTHVIVAAPAGSHLRRMDIMTFVNFVWPEIEKAFDRVPPDLLLVGAGDPMWRGGLSAPNSFFLHAERPLVSENSTSPLVHEMVHMATRIVGDKTSDWIAEGLAEFYSVELMYRAGGMTLERRSKAFQTLANWGKDVDTLIRPKSSGKVTARAAVLFDQLDRELRQTGKYSIDDVTRQLMTGHKASLKRIRLACRKLLKHPCVALQSPLLNG